MGIFDGEFTEVLMKNNLDSSFYSKYLKDKQNVKSVLERADEIIDNLFILEHEKVCSYT